MRTETIAPCPAASGSVDFRTYFPRADFDRVASHFLSVEFGEAHDGEWREEYVRIRQETADKALRGFLRALRADGVLVNMAGGTGRRIAFIEYWNRVTGHADVSEEQERTAWGQIVESFAHTLLFETLYAVSERIGDGEAPGPLLDAAYEQLVSWANSGNFTPGSMGINEHMDAVTGRKFSISLNAWRPVLGRVVRGRFEPATDTDLPVLDGNRGQTSMAAA